MNDMEQKNCYMNIKNFLENVDTQILKKEYPKLNISDYKQI